MPAKNAQPDAFGYPPGSAEYDLRHNPGHDFLRMLRWCALAEPAKFNDVFAAYSRNPIAVLIGSAAIEGYTNYAGHLCCKDWKEFIKGEGVFSKKLKRIFSSCEKPLDLSQGVYQQTVKLIQFRGSLAHPRFNHHKEVRDAPPPTLFDHIDFDYPAAKVLKIATGFKDSLLNDLQLEDLSWRQSYTSK
jgi:hypothetical protein